MNILILEDSPYRRKEFRSHFPCAHLVEQVYDCIGLLENAKEPWDLVFLDHDLNSEVYVDSNRSDTGMEVVRWIGQNKPAIRKIIVHSLNHDAVDIMVLNLISFGYDVQAIPFVNLDMKKIQDAISDIV